jgi:hypothetical protein
MRNQFPTVPSAVIMISVILHIIKKNSASGGKATATTFALEEILFLAEKTPRRSAARTQGAQDTWATCISLKTPQWLHV